MTMSLRHYACPLRFGRLWVIACLLIIAGGKPMIAQTPQQFFLFKNYFVTGDYTVGGWVEQSSANGFATGTISIPDPKQPNATGIPIGANIVAAYLYWGTVEGNQSSFVGQQAYFNGYKV